MKKHKRILWTKKEEELLKKNYSKLKNEELKKLLKNRTYVAITLRANKLGLFKNNGSIKGDVTALLNDTNEVYYWIGFIMADGTINHKQNILKVGLNFLDLEHLKKLSKFLKMGDPHRYKKIVELKIMDNYTLPSIIEKYDFKPRKTYNPPNLEYLNLNDDYFYSFLIGFIDGDGTILKRKGREEYRISIKLHNSWFNNLKFFHNKISKLLDVEPKGIYDYKFPILTFSDFRILKQLKRKAIEFGLPILDRKWNKIDLNRVTRIEQGEINRIKIKKMLLSGKSVNEISKKTGLTYSNVYAIVNYN